MASRALLSVCWCRRAVAWVRYRVWSALVIAGFLAGRDRFEPGDDAFQVVLDQAEIGGQAGLAVGVGAGDQAQVDRGLAAVGVEEFRSGLEVGAGQAGVGVVAVLLGRPAAVAVGQAVPDPGQVVLDPLGGRGGRVRVVAEGLSGDVDPLALVVVERLANSNIPTV
jgi:hypothetical protein